MEKKEKDKKSSKKENDKVIKNTIDLNPTIDEEKSSTAVFTFGRMNPPTIGHEKLVKKVEDIARQNNAMPHIYLSQSHDSKKNPLPYKTKIAIARKAFGSAVTTSSSKTVIQIAKELEEMGHKNLIMVVGSDRVNEFRTLLNKYNGKDFTFDTIEVVSAGERDPDADGPEGMSASKMRDAVTTGNEDAFKQGLPTKLKRNSKTIFNAVKSGLAIAEELEAEFGVEELSEVLNLAQRRKRAIAFRRSKAKVLRGRKIAQRRMASKDKLKVRARRKAIQLIRRRVAGAKGLDYTNLSPAEKEQIDKRVAQRKGAIAKIASRLMPKVTKAERERLKTFLSSKNEEVSPDVLNIIMEAYFKVDIEGLPPVFMTGPSGSSIKTELRKIIKKPDENVLSIDRVQRTDIIKAFRLQAQGKTIDDEEPIGVDEAFEMMIEREDKDIGDREGSQPAKYHSGLAKSTKEKRDRQFKKAAEKDSGDSSAYPEKHAGDEGVKTKTSVHTKRYHQMFSKENAMKHDGRFRYNKKVTEEKELFAEIDNMLNDIANDLFEQMIEEKSLEGLKKKAEKSGIPYNILKKVYDRGMAAWRTGHRPGAGQEQWAYARVNSFITKGKGTWGKADADLAAQVRGKSVEEAKNHSWRSEGHYLENGEEWDGDQHAYEGEVYTGKEHEPDSKRLYHYKELPANIRAKIDAELGEAKSWDQQAAIAIAKKKSGKYDEDGKRIKEDIAIQLNHDKCGTPDCCGQCDTATNDLNESFTAMIGDTVFANEFSELHTKGGFALHPSVESIDESDIKSMLFAKDYKHAAEILKKVILKKAREGKTPGYWASEIAKQYPEGRIDPRKLVSMVVNEEHGAGEEGTDELVKKYKKDTPGQ